MISWCLRALGVQFLLIFTSESEVFHISTPQVDTGLGCLVMIAKLHEMAADPDQLAHQYQPDGEPFSKSDILLASKQLGLQTKAVKTEAGRLNRTPLPAIAIGKDGDFFILARQEGEETLIFDLVTGRPEKLSITDLATRWTGEVILFQSRASVAGEMGKFDFTWFIPAIMKYRKLFTEVLVHRGFTTLDVIAFGLFVVVIFQVVLTTLRSYVFAHTTSRIDTELGAQLFRHLINLPLSYFHARRVGDSVARVRELENIRSFLTGNAITVLLDLLFCGVFLAVMLYYSRWLTLIVVLSLPCYALFAASFTPVLRSNLNEKFNRGAENHAFLVETISGIGTAKAMAIEPQMTRRWDNQLAGYVSSNFRTTTVGNFYISSLMLVGKLVTVATIWLGARLVISGEMTVGQLIAFNMLAGQVAQPVMRLAQLWTDFQQTGISMQRLGDILNARTEIAGAKSTLPPIEGRIVFDDVVFRYLPGSPEVLRGINLDIRAGEVIGIVGPSGSGKSTVTKLVQRLYVPERGRVLIDGLDLALADTSSLRRQVGMVLQENVLFNRTIRENIALAEPGADMERVIQAAELAGAHEFILELPEAYDTMVGEHGETLSGGRRQRIAIARALMTNPRILIFDEATSALDYESERVIQNNMKAICEGRTVIIVAHRLSAVRVADRIVVIDHGQVVETGPHAELLRNKDGYYFRLHAMQQG